jgi:uncharacterized membrane protein
MRAAVLLTLVAAAALLLVVIQVLPKIRSNHLISCFFLGYLALF